MKRSIPAWMGPFRDVIRVECDRTIEEALDIPRSLNSADWRWVDRQRVIAQIKVLERMRDRGLIATTPRPGFDPKSGFEAQAVPVRGVS